MSSVTRMEDGAWFILQRGDGHPMSGHSTAGLDVGSAEPGPPMRFLTEVPSYYGTKHQPPGDLYSHMDFIGMDEPPAVIACAALWERLNAAAPGLVNAVEVELVDTQQATHRYFALTAVKRVETKDEAPGDLCWASTAFDPKGALPAVFALGEYLVVSREIALALRVDEFKEVVVSAFSVAE
ncbi:MAG: hypothetical protein QM817_29385 [Archangium sp.]